MRSVRKMVLAAQRLDEQLERLEQALAMVLEQRMDRLERMPAPVVQVRVPGMPVRQMLEQQRLCGQAVSFQQLH